MTAHIKAWENEYRSSIWDGHYSLEELGKTKGRVLDAGCGSGKYAIPMKIRGLDVVAIDASQAAIKQTCGKSRIHDIDLEIMAADVHRLPFSDLSFDAIWCYGVLQHLLSRERVSAISEFLRVLRDGGKLFIEVFGKDDMRYGGTEVEPDTFSRESGIIYHYFSREELNGLLDLFSCQITETRKEKQFNGRKYIRHMISATARKEYNRKRAK